MKHLNQCFLTNKVSVALAWLTLTCASMFTVTRTQDQNQPFSLTITGPTAAITPGSSCDIAVTVMNISSKMIQLSANNNPKLAFKDYGITVTDESSGAMLKQDLTRVQPPAKYSLSSRNTQYLDHGDVIRQIIPLCKLYDLSLTGEYEVQITRIIPKKLGRGEVESNSIEITVTAQ